MGLNTQKVALNTLEMGLNTLFWGPNTSKNGSQHPPKKWKC